MQVVSGIRRHFYSPKVCIVCVSRAATLEYGGVEERVNLTVRQEKGSLG